MSPTAGALAAIHRLSPGLDHDAWVRFVRDAVLPDGEWRPGEFDPERWLFTGDPDNPMTTSTRCLVSDCETVVGSRMLCNSCRRALTDSGLAEEEFVRTHRPSLAHYALTGEMCVVGRDGVRCQRRSNSNRTGLCPVHSIQWGQRGKWDELSFEEWCIQVARPLPARPGCAVAGCQLDADSRDSVCNFHRRCWRTSQAEVPDERHESVEQWAARQLPRLQVHQFGLAGLAPTVRWEVLYALQQRDRQGQRLDPVAMTALIHAVGDLEALAVTPHDAVNQRISKAGIARSYANLFVRIVHLKFEAFRGITHTDKDVWDSLALDLEDPRPGRRPNLSTIDFTPITQQWLRDAVKQWVRIIRPESEILNRTLHACTLASQALSRRPGGGHDIRTLKFAEMTVAFDAIKNATRADGQRYHSHFRSGLLARFFAVIDLGRSTELLSDLPGAFSRNSMHTITRDELNEDEIGKAIPESVIAQLDAHLDLLEASHTYGMSWSATDTAMMFRTAYHVLRDTGRRPGEVVSLAADCLEFDSGEYALVYDNRKKRRLRRRLPITAETAEVIQHWQHYRAGLDLPTSGQRWLFPACWESSGPGHLTTLRFAAALRRWVAAIPVLHGDLPGPDGAPLPLDRSLIYAYAFRHSYAQRHADAGVPLEILSDLMDHKHLNVTQGYYKVSLKRKREAIKIMSRYVQDRTGASCTGSGSVASYELRSVAVPFGNCIEPTNVKAGGQQCPIRFQCAGCGFYRPDPSYLPAIEEHINALRADRETALAVDAAEFVVRNMTDQIDAFSDVAATMRDKLQVLPDDERDEVEVASVILRKVRAGRAHKLLPLTVEDSK